MKAYFLEEDYYDDDWYEDDGYPSSGHHVEGDIYVYDQEYEYGYEDEAVWLGLS